MEVFFPCIKPIILQSVPFADFFKSRHESYQDLHGITESFPKNKQKKQWKLMTFGHSGGSFTTRISSTDWNLCCFVQICLSNTILCRTNEPVNRNKLEFWFVVILECLYHLTCINIFKAIPGGPMGKELTCRLECRFCTWIPNFYFPRFNFLLAC